MTRPVVEEPLAEVIPLTLSIGEGIVENRLIKTALGVGHFLGKAKIEGTSLDEAMATLEQAHQDGRTLGVSEVLLHLTAGDTEVASRERADRTRTVIQTIFPGIKEMAFSDVAITRLFSVLPQFSAENIGRFHHKTQASLETQLRRLQKSVDGLTDSQIARDEGVTPPAISQGRKNLVRALGDRIQFDELIEAAKAQLIESLGASTTLTSPVVTERPEEPDSVEEVIIAIRDGKLKTSDPSDLTYTRTGSFELPPNFDAEVITYLNSQRGNVHISDIINTIISRRLDRGDFIAVRRHIEELCEAGAAFNMGRGYFATYAYGENLAAKGADQREITTFELPEDFNARVIELASSYPTVHIGAIVRELFGARLESSQFGIVRSAVSDMCSKGQLISLGDGNFRLANPIENSVSDWAAQDEDGDTMVLPKKSLDEMLREAGIHRTTQQFRRGRRRR